MGPHRPPPAAIDVGILSLMGIDPRTNPRDPYTWGTASCSRWPMNDKFGRGTPTWRNIRRSKSGKRLAAQCLLGAAEELLSIHDGKGMFIGKLENLYAAVLAACDDVADRGRGQCSLFPPHGRTTGAQRFGCIVRRKNRRSILDLNSVRARKYFKAVITGHGDFPQVRAIDANAQPALFQP
jgi:hypothetical protein